MSVFANLAYAGQANPTAKLLNEHSSGMPFGIGVMLDVNASQFDTGNLIQCLADMFGIRFQVCGIRAVVCSYIYNSAGFTVHRTKI